MNLPILPLKPLWPSRLARSKCLQESGTRPKFNQLFLGLLDISPENFINFIYQQTNKKMSAVTKLGCQCVDREEKHNYELAGQS